MVLILTVAVGVGLFLVVAMLRTIFRIKLSHMLIAFYLLVFILSIFVPNDFIPVAFDSGGAASGPMTSTFLRRHDWAHHGTFYHGAGDRYGIHPR